MSSYQYFEFLAIDGPISDEGMRYAEGCSTRAKVSRHRWQNTYHYGDFHGSVDKLLKYYDAHFYIANWGTVRLGLAFPADCLKPELLHPYLQEGERYGDTLTASQDDGRCIVWWEWNDERGFGWTDGEGIINQLVGIREEMMFGDHRALFLGWLADFDPEEWLDFEDSSDLIPSIPADLDNLSSSLLALIEHFPVDGDAFAVASQLSQPVTRDRIPITKVIENLSESQMRALLQRVAQGDGAKVSSELNRLTYPIAETPVSPAITCSEFAEKTLEARELRLKKEAKAAEAKRKREQEARKKHLASVMKRADTIWAGLDPLMDQKIASVYDQATAQLQELRDAYLQAQETASFQQKLNAFRERYARRSAMIRRIEDL